MSARVAQWQSGLFVTGWSQVRFLPLAFGGGCERTHHRLLVPGKQKVVTVAGQLSPLYLMPCWCRADVAMIAAHNLGVQDWLEGGRTGGPIPPTADWAAAAMDADNYPQAGYGTCVRRLLLSRFNES